MRKIVARFFKGPPTTVELLGFDEPPVTPAVVKDNSMASSRNALRSYGSLAAQPSVVLVAISRSGQADVLAGEASGVAAFMNSAFWMLAARWLEAAAFKETLPSGATICGKKSPYMGSDAFFGSVVYFAVATSADSNDQDYDRFPINSIDDACIACADPAAACQTAA